VIARIAVLLAFALAACETRTAEEPGELAAVGPVSVGMTGQAAFDSLAARGLRVACETERVYTECRTVHAAGMGITYHVLSRRVVYAARRIQSSDLSLPGDSAATGWRADGDSAPSWELPYDTGMVSLVRWNLDSGRLYRLHRCFRWSRRTMCEESVWDRTPATVGAHVMDLVSRFYGGLVICDRWSELAERRCEQLWGSATERQRSPDELLRRTERESESAPAGTLLFETRQGGHVRLWRRSDGLLHGLRCESSCEEVVFPYEPEAFFAAYREP
jgi:hypothetical protein